MKEQQQAAQQHSSSREKEEEEEEEEEEGGCSKFKDDRLSRCGWHSDRLAQPIEWTRFSR